MEYFPCIAYTLLFRLEEKTMGEGLLQLYRTKLKKEYKTAFISTFFLALLIHLYKLANTLPNHDALYNYYSDQNVLGSGRWALSFACGISSYYDLPWINGLLSCVFVALTVVVVVAVFKMKNPILIGLTGALVAAAPATTETFFFTYTADGYMLAMFLSALAVWFSTLDEKRISRWILSGVCICVSCGIYQAYVSFALLLAVCYFIDLLLQGTHSRKDCLKWVLRQVVTYAAALAAYLVIWKLCMHFTGTAANAYQGISQVGRVGIGLLINGLISSVKTVMLYFLQWDVVGNGFTLYSVLSIAFLVTMAAGLVLAVIRSGILKRMWAVILLVLCVIAVIPFACIWHFTSDSIGYRAMMLQSLTLLFVLTAVLFERWAKPRWKNAVGILLAVVVFNNALMANISYFYMNLGYERTYAESVEIVTQIHALQREQDFDKIAVIGSRHKDVQWIFSDPETGAIAPAGRIYMLSSLLESSLLYDSDHIIFFLKANYGLELEPVSGEMKTQLAASPDVEAMGCWPQGDGIKVIGNTLVIKLSNPQTAE